MHKKHTDESGIYTEKHIPYCRQSRKAARHMHKAFLAWQKDMKERKGEDGACACSEYEAWFARQREEHGQKLTAQQRQEYEELAERQGRVYGAWAKKHGDAQEQQAALLLQEEVLADNRHMLLANMQDDALSVQSLEQIMAAAREKARLQGFSQQEIHILEERSVTEALYAVLWQGIEEGHFDDVTHVLRNHGMLLDHTNRHALQQKLFEAQEHTAMQAHTEAQAQAEQHARRTRVEQACVALSQSIAADTGTLHDEKLRATLPLCVPTEDAILMSDTDKEEACALARATQHIAKQAAHAHKTQAECELYRSIIQLCTEGEQYDPLEAIRRVYAHADTHPSFDEVSRAPILEAIIDGRISLDKTAFDDDATLLALQARLVSVEGSALQPVELLRYVCQGRLCYATGASFLNMEKALQKPHKVFLSNVFQQAKALCMASTLLQEQKQSLGAALGSLLLQQYMEAVKENNIEMLLKRTNPDYAKKLVQQFFMMPEAMGVTDGVNEIFV